jgi:hypothetical protein
MIDRTVLPGDLIMTSHRTCITIVVNDDILSQMSIDLYLRVKKISIVAFGVPEKCIFLTQAD